MVSRCFFQVGSAGLRYASVMSVLSICCLAAAAAVIAPAWALAAPAPLLLLSEDRALRSNTEFQTEGDRIQLLREENNFRELDSVANSIQGKWSSNSDPNTLYALEDLLATAMSDACRDSPDATRQRGLSGQLALKLLSDPAVPIDIGANMEPILYAKLAIDRGNSQITYEEWASERESYVSLWLILLRRLNAAIQPLPKERRIILENSAPDDSNAARSADRTQRGAAGQPERGLAAVDLVQSELRTIRSAFTPALESALVRAYSQAPHNGGELTTLFAKYSTDSEFCAAVYSGLTIAANANEKRP